MAADSPVVGRIEFGPWPGSREATNRALPGEAVALAKLKRVRILLDHAGERDLKEVLAEIRRIVGV